MKIKELHLRNIASIEKADIDFEKGLNDGVTGTPASVFLICGDTGAGKTVILDGISMALYKTSPRIKGVSDKKNNRFTNEEGEAVNVGSIEQYTRLGISASDECYSEVAFTGNDGVDYRARLTLGMMQKRNAERSLAYRTPVWEVKIGAGDWTKDNVAGTIENAVGLSFMQFGRMAMLAQGQFAAFLTGDKKEREEILEQLTNTELFSRYGDAIKSLFDKAKADWNLAQAEFNTEQQHTLPQEQVDRLTEDKSRLENEKDGLAKRIAETDRQIAEVTALESGTAKAALGTEEKARLDAVRGSDDYKSRSALIADWDTTVTERQTLARLKDARIRMDSARKDEARQKERFALLSADLEARREAVRAQGDPQKAVDAKQAEIDTLTGKYNALNPSQVNEDLARVADDITSLGNIATRQEALDNSRKEIARLADEIKADEQTAATKKEACDKADAAYTEAKSKADDAAARLSTMKMSVEETLTTLRRSLAEQHQDVCPLCGQHLHEIHLEDEFRGMLTPLEQEQKAAVTARDEAEKTRNAAMRDYNRFSGTLNQKREDLTGREKSLGTATDTLRKDASRFGIDIARPLGEQIRSVQGKLDGDRSRLIAAQEQAAALLKAIEAARTAKKPLDAALKKFQDDTRTVQAIESHRLAILSVHSDWESAATPATLSCADIVDEWSRLSRSVSATELQTRTQAQTLSACQPVLDEYYARTGKTEADLDAIAARQPKLAEARRYVGDIDQRLKSAVDAVASAEADIRKALAALGIAEVKDAPARQTLLDVKAALDAQNNDINGRLGAITDQLGQNEENTRRLDAARKKLDTATARRNKWDILNNYFGGTRFRTLVQTHILRPLLDNANIYLERITDRYLLTCSEENEQLSILVHDRYNKDQVRSVTVLSGGERFMISLALSLALSSLNRPDMNVNILFIDEGFGTLDEKSLDSVMETLERLGEIAGQSNRRVGIISHREELDERIPVQIRVKKKGEGRSLVEVGNLPKA